MVSDGIIIKSLLSTRFHLLLQKRTVKIIHIHILYAIIGVEFEFKLIF